MENIYKAMKTILLFVVVMLVVNTAFGDKVAQRLAIFTLFSMLILQSEKVSNYLSAITDNLTAGT